MHDGLVHLHASGEPNGLVAAEPRPGRLLVRPVVEFGDQLGGGRAEQSKRFCCARGACRLLALDCLALFIGECTGGENAGPVGVHLCEVPKQVGRRPVRAGGDGRRRVGRNDSLGEQFCLGADDGGVVEHVVDANSAH